MKDESDEQKKKELVLTVYVRFAEKNGRHPSLADLKAQSISREMVRQRFTNLAGLRKQAKLFKPDTFKNIIDGELFTQKKLEKLYKVVGNYDRFVITTAVTGCKVHTGFLESIRTYCEKNKALLLILPSQDPAAVVTSKSYIDPILAKDFLVFGDLQINRSLFISSIKLSAKHIDPITGMGRIGQRQGSFIYASPKQRLKMTATHIAKLPHAMMTTGAITLPDYHTERYMSERTAYIADNDHVMGAVIVEVENSKFFHFRQIQADSQGSFVDLGVFYKQKEVGQLRPEALVLGDWHSGETDPRARACFLENADSVASVLKPKSIFVHDGFNGLSINHHEEKNRILRAQRAENNELSLEAELKKYAEDLDFLASKTDMVYVVRSNHDDFLYRYLAEARYVEDPQNHYLALKLAQAMFEKKNPIQVAVESFGLKRKDKIKWLTRKDSIKIARIEMAAHGDKGPNGSGGTLRGMEASYGNSVTGHAHTPEILRGSWRVGTCSKLELGYNEDSPSSWMLNANLTYSNGMRQLINVINNKWRKAPKRL